MVLYLPRTKYLTTEGRGWRRGEGWMDWGEGSRRGERGGGRGGGEEREGEERGGVATKY